MNKILNYVADQFVFLNLKKISDGYLNLVDSKEKEYFFGVSNLTDDYVNFIKENGAVNKSFFNSGTSPSSVTFAFLIPTSKSFSISVF